MNSRIKKLAVIVTVLAVSLLVFAGASLAQGGTPPTITTPDSAVTTPLQQMQEWMGADAWGQMIQRMTQVHGAEFTGQMMQQMNSSTGMMGGSFHTPSGGMMGGGMMGGGFHTSGNGLWGNMMNGFQGMMGGYER